MSKQVLDVQQMQHLQELGLELKETMLYWVVYEVGHENNFVTTRENAMEVIDEICGMLPAYTLQDVLDALPEFIEEYCLIIDMSFGVIRYDNLTKRNNPILKETYFNDEDKYLIDAAYEMLCWDIENKFVETNKNK